jgi:probable rRNA maturation factor
MAAHRAIHLYNRQRRVRFDLAWLRRFAVIALEECEGEGIEAGGPPGLPGELEVSIVSDRVIAEVHRRFMDIEGATDVITFEHGEIVISAAMAERQGKEHGQRLEEELGLYIIHGILHLAGYEDVTDYDSARMNKKQEEILDLVLGIINGA